MRQDEIRQRLPFIIALGLGLTIQHKNGNRVRGQSGLVTSDYFRPSEWYFDEDFRRHVETVLQSLESSAKLVQGYGLEGRSRKTP